MDSRRASPVPLAGVTSDGGLRAISVTEMEPWLSEVEQHSMPGGLGLIASPARGGQYDGDILSPRQLFVPRFERSLPLASSGPAKLPFESVVQIFTVSCEPSYLLPWQVSPQISSSGSGFAVQLKSGEKYVLTNAHVKQNPRIPYTPSSPCVLSFCGVLIGGDCSEATVLRLTESVRGSLQVASSTVNAVLRAQKHGFAEKYHACAVCIGIGRHGRRCHQLAPFLFPVCVSDQKRRGCQLITHHHRRRARLRLRPGSAADRRPGILGRPAHCHPRRCHPR